MSIIQPTILWTKSIRGKLDKVSRPGPPSCGQWLTAISIFGSSRRKRNGHPPVIGRRRRLAFNFVCRRAAGVRLARALNQYHTHPEAPPTAPSKRRGANRLPNPATAIARDPMAPASATLIVVALGQSKSRTLMKIGS